MKKILDMTCSSRGIWFDKENPLVTFCDIRDCEIEKYYPSGYKKHVVHPDVVCDFTKLPFEDNTFNLVVFDPPHLIGDGNKNGWIAKRYGYYCTYEDAISAVSRGIDEGIRVLKNNGVLIFKWNDVSMTASEIIKNLNYKPLFGHKSGSVSKTHWMCFMKITGED